MTKVNVSNYLPIIFSLLVAVLLLPLGVWQVTQTQQKQELRGMAASPGGTAILLFEPTSGSVYAGNTLPMTIKFSTPTTPDNKGITGIKAVLDCTGAQAFDLTSSDIQTSLSNPWSYARIEATALTITPTPNKVTHIIIEAVYLQAGDSGYTGATSLSQIFATLNLRAKDSGSAAIGFSCTFDPQKSEIRAKSGNFDILSPNLAAGSYTIYVDNIPPETTISSGPAASIHTPTATFVFTGTDSPSPPAGTAIQELVYSYKLDQGNWSEYSSTTQVTLTSFSVGQHNFQVRAKDRAGNIDPTSASWPFAYEPRTVLDLRLKFQGLSSQSQNYPKPIKITIKKSDYNSGILTATVTYDSGNTSYLATVTLPGNFPSGTNSYQVLVKGQSHLQKRWDGVTLTKNEDNLLTKTSSADELIRGDVTDDNFIKLGDITGIISVWTQSETPVTTAIQKYDLTEDGLITISDITAIISNWTRSEVEGDK